MRVNFGRISPFAPVLKEISVDAALAVAPRPKGDVDALVHLAKDDMAAVDALIIARMQSDVPVIPLLAEHLVSAGGKRLRPLLTVAAARAIGQTGAIEGPKKLAASVEFIHTATLLHDDIVDGSEMRRGKVAAHLIWGSASSVLVGDFLFARAFELMVETDSLRALGILARASAVIAEGEVLQLVNMHDPDISVDDYLRVIEYKTAKLFEASTRLGALISDASPEVEEACAAYGRALGTAFQLIDDLLDYEGTTAELGKNIGDDLREGKPTLPLLAAMSRGTPEQREMIRNAIIHGEVERMPDIVEVVKATGALQVTREAAQAQVDVAKKCLAALPPSEWREALLELSLDSIHRSS